MYKKLNILIIFCFCTLGSTAQEIERKIIIQDGIYYYVTVDDNYQLGTLYKGFVDQKLNQSKAYALPAGRGISAETNPLAWDINGEDLYAINFLDHSLNDRYESIKKINLNSLKIWGPSVQIGDVLMESVDKNNYIFNEPYLFIKKRSDFLNHFYFDAIVYKGNYWMVITNNDELTIWKYSNDEWEHSSVKKFKTEGFFHLFAHKKDLKLITNKGNIFNLDIDKINQIEMDNNTIDLNNCTIIEDRDNKKFFYIKNGSFNYEKSLSDIIKDNGIQIMKK